MHSRKHSRPMLSLLPLNGVRIRLRDSLKIFDLSKMRFLYPVSTSWFRKSVAVFTAVCLLAGSTHLPAPVETRKDTSIPFPCQDTACDCRNADDCWASCCCNSDEEKLAWARQHNVSPPNWFVEGLRKSNHKGMLAGAACCKSKSSASCCSQSSAKELPSCCANKRQQSRVASCSTLEQRVVANRSSKPVKIAVTLRQQRRCNGADGVFHLDLRFVAPNQYGVSYLNPNPRYAVFDVPAQSVTFPPPTPPPRLA